MLKYNDLVTKQVELKEVIESQQNLNRTIRNEIKINQDNTKALQMEQAASFHDKMIKLIDQLKRMTTDIQRKRMFSS